MANEEPLIKYIPTNEADRRFMETLDKRLEEKEKETGLKLRGVPPTDKVREQIGNVECVKVNMEKVFDHAKKMGKTE